MHAVARPIALAVAAVSLTALATGCSTPQAAGPALTRATSTPDTSAPTRVANDARDGVASSDPASAADPFDVLGGRLKDLPVLTQIAATPDPVGSREQIALRFLRALQAHDDLAADRELTGFARGEFAALDDLDSLHHFLADARRHSQIDTAEGCTTARQIGNDSVLVTCGPTTVLVHVQHDHADTGVEITDWDDWSDTYPGPHTRSVTTVEF
jgi:hypothetical protein